MTPTDDQPTRRALFDADSRRRLWGRWPWSLVAAGMSLFDTLDGAFIQAAYQWAFVCPVRKIHQTWPPPACPSPPRC